MITGTIQATLVLGLRAIALPALLLYFLIQAWNLGSRPGTGSHNKHNYQRARVAALLLATIFILNRPKGEDQFSISHPLEPLSAAWTGPLLLVVVTIPFFVSFVLLILYVIARYRAASRPRGNPAITTRPAKSSSKWTTRLEQLAYDPLSTFVCTLSMLILSYAYFFMPIFSKYFLLQLIAAASSTKLVLLLVSTKIPADRPPDLGNNPNDNSPPPEPSTAAPGQLTEKKNR